MIVVVKVGTSSLIRAEQQTLNLSNLARICETVKTLRQAGHDVIIVSSGAVGAGCQRLGIRTRPSGNLAQKQALAAVGQLYLMRYYSDMLSSLDLVLLTLDNLASRGTYLNARNTFAELLAMGTIPVVNENDTVAVEQLRFGDNDTLSAQVAALVGADLLFLLTDVDCLYTANPSTDPDAQPIQEVADISKLAVDTSTHGTQWGTGGMATKLTAGRIATAAGTRMVICNCQEPERLAAFVLQDRHVGTVFHPLPGAARGRKRWILAVPVMGRVLLDRGAVAAVGGKKKSLFPAGILRVEGEFSAQEGVQLCDEAGQEFARALVNYTSAEIDRMKGKQSVEWRSILGYVGSEEVAHRDNITVLAALEHESDSDDPPAVVYS